MWLHNILYSSSRSAGLMGHLYRINFYDGIKTFSSILCHSAMWRNICSRLITRFLLSDCRLHELWRRQLLNDHNVTELFVKLITNSSLPQTLVTPCSAICHGEQQGENVMAKEEHFLAHFYNLSHKTANQHLYTKMLKAAQRELTDTTSP